MPVGVTRKREETSVSNVAAVHAKAVELGKHVLRMTTASGSGHPTSALALSHIVVELMYRRMRWDPANPWNPHNDRLVLSLGHAVPIIYAAYADLGGVIGKSEADARALAVDDLARLRELDSVLDGHPNPAEGFPFFDAATGSLGQGLSVGAGLAAAAKLDGVDRRIFVLIGDGESREGQIWEAADFVVDHKLDNVCAIFSCNEYGQAGPVSPQQSPEALGRKLDAFGWKVIEIDGHDPAEIAAAFDGISWSGKPTAIVARTVKGWGVPSTHGKNYHGKPLSETELPGALAELDETARTLGASSVPDWTPPAPKDSRGASAKPAANVSPVSLPPFEQAVGRAGLGASLEKKKLATRQAYGVALVALGDIDKRFVSIDGDVSNSTFANMFAKEHGDRFFEGKIAEQNMVSVGAGMAAAGKVPFVSSFGKFLARGADQIDMAAISRANLKLVGSHSGVSLGADGPSQMSVSDVAYFRSLTRVDSGNGEPACFLFNPADAVCAYRCVELMANIRGMCYLRTHRPEAPFLYPFGESFALRGCKQLRRGDRLTIVSSGYMLFSALDAAKQLAESGIECNVFDAYTFPLDASPVLEAARKAGGAILTVEDNYIGGLHAELAEAAAVRGEVRVVGLTANRIPKSAKTAEEVFAYVGVGLDQIVEQARAMVG
jgi:transketolase